MTYVHSVLLVRKSIYQLQIETFEVSIDANFQVEFIVLRNAFC